jgi:hypothetical protein
MIDLKNIVSFRAKKSPLEAIIFFVFLVALLFVVMSVELNYIHSAYARNHNGQQLLEGSDDYYSALGAVKVINAIIISFFVYLVAKKRELLNSALAVFGAFMLAFFIGPAAALILAAFLSYVEKEKYDHALSKLSKKKGS